MDVGNVLHMKAGNGESSYASNSFLQRTVIQKTLPVLNETIKGMIDNRGLPQCFKVADLGCSSGPNTLLVISNIMDKVHELCKENSLKGPQFQVFLNDLFGNDFNAIFKSLPVFYAMLKKEKGENFGPCFISGVPGSFYGRLFPDKSLHLVHSSYCIQWLSQVPEGLENNGTNIYMAQTSPPNVFEAYRMQFQKDFTLFLQSRSQELVRGGRMVLAFLGRSTADPTSDGCCHIWGLLAQSFRDMVKQGMIQEAEISSFNIPNYSPCEDEVKNVIENQGSFSLDDFKDFQVNWDPYNRDYTNTNASTDPINGKNTANLVRAVIEPLLVSHFKNLIVDEVFEKYKKYVAEHLAIKKTRFFNIVISLTKI